MTSTDILKAKGEASSALNSDVEQFLASGGSIERVEGQDHDSWIRLQKAKRRNYYTKKAEAKAKYRRLAMISAAHKKLGNG